jgi:integrase
MRKNFALSSEQRADAREAIRILHGTGLSLKDAARVATAQGERREAMTIDAAIEEFLRDREAHVRPDTLRFYEQHLTTLSESMGSRVVSQVERRQWKKWIGSQRGRLASVRAMLGFLETLDPAPGGRWLIRGVAVRPKAYAEPEFLTVDEVRRIMAEAYELTPAMALLFFAGIRPGELGDGAKKPRLTWASVNVAERWVRIPARNAKTGRPRLLEGLPDNLWAWLEPYARGKDQPICPYDPLRPSRWAKKVIGRWTHDATRHSFASYHSAMGDLAHTSMLLGHEGSQTMLHRHYRGLVSRADAEEYFAIGMM